MIKETIEKINLDFYTITLKNGIKVYVLPNKKEKTAIAKINVKFGSETLEYNDKKLKTGIAHFLEHMMFKNEDGVEPFDYFSKNQASANAYTAEFMTAYYFVSQYKSFMPNFKYLIKYFSEPYFTETDTKKESKIIEQEYFMCKDRFYEVGYDRLMENMYHLLPQKTSIIGTREDILSISANNLKDCYNDLYNANNIYITITGNVDINKIEQEVLNNEHLNSFKSKEINRKQYNEPNEVVKKTDRIKLNVENNKLFLGYKLNVNKLLKTYTPYEIEEYISIYLNSLFGGASKTNNKLVDNNIIKSNISYDVMLNNGFISLLFIIDTDNFTKVKNIIDKNILSKDLNEDDFNRYIKKELTDYVKRFDNNMNLNNHMSFDYIFKDGYNTNIYEELNTYTYDEYKTIINNLDFTNSTICTIEKNN